LESNEAYSAEAAGATWDDVEDKSRRAFPRSAESTRASCAIVCCYTSSDTPYIGTATAPIYPPQPAQNIFLLRAFVRAVDCCRKRTRVLTVVISTSIPVTSEAEQLILWTVRRQTRFCQIGCMLRCNKAAETVMTGI